MAVIEPPGSSGRLNATEFIHPSRLNTFRLNAVRLNPAGFSIVWHVPERAQLELLQHGDCGFEHGSIFVESSTTLSTDIPDFFEPQLLLTANL